MSPKSIILSKTVLGIIGGAAFTLGSQGLLAQAVKDSIRSTPAAEEKASVLEEVEVHGVRSALEDALNVKREASSIVDAISAKDIDALPALDLGEALQVLPGVQLNRDDGQRNSEISLRGLPGGFVKTTGAGQSFATPSRDQGDVGASNPFGSFEASVFDGVSVVKSPTADMQAGGIAGIVDLKFQEALSKPDGRFSVNLGSRYEELSDNWDGEFKVSGSKHLIEDKLAIAFKLAGSEQNFRRDTVNFTQYLNLNGDTPEQARTQMISQADLDAYRELHGLESNSIVQAIARSGQVSEVSEGDRISGTFNIEYQVSEGFKLGAHYLKTKRSLDESSFEDVSFQLRNQRDVASQQVELIGDPIKVASNEDGLPTYSVGHVILRNVDWAPANRVFSFVEEAEGLFLYGDYTGEDWEIDSTVTYSESSNEFINQGLDIRHTTQNGTFPNPAGGPRIPWAPSGIDVEVNTGNGNLSHAFTRPLSGIDSFVYDGDWSEVALSGFSSQLDPTVNGNRRVQFFVNGRVDRPERTVESYEANFKRFVNFEFGDAFKIDAIKAGFRYSVEDLENSDLRIGGGGINVGALSEETIFGDRKLFSETQNEYFNGDYPGFYGSDAGWRTLDSKNLIAAIQEDMRDLEGAIKAEPTGFNIRLENGRNQFFATNFDVEQAITAGYVMADFSGQIGSLPYSGNIGVRQVETRNDITGASEVNGELVDARTEVDYGHTLPSFNGVLELREDLLLRVAGYRGIVRPNLRAANPSTIFNDTDSNVRVDLPASDVKPYKADNLDLSLEWYNRAGSAISIGLFTKKITGLFARERVCPVGQEASFGGIFGPLERIDLPGGDFECQEIDPFVSESGEVLDNRTVVVNRSFNTDDSIKVKGWELAVQQKLDFLPYPWNGFGGVFNYTDLDTEQANDTALTRVSPKSYNVVGYWENEDVSIRLSYNWRDEQLISLPSATGFLGTDAREETARGRLDLSASYRINDRFRLNASAFNLTNNEGYEFVGGNSDAVHRITYTGRQFQVSGTVTF
ncbi:MAG: TonB-dependent receptor [Gammaproteobacteria bacterium]|nr:TonB-dependent receptor [Gammaproteobacteria bacterium]